MIADALDASGITTWAGQRLVAAARSDPTRLVALVLLLCAGLSAIITPNGAIAALVPMMVMVAARIDRPPSKLLMPLAFSAHAGSLLVLTGSPVNILVADAGDFGFIEFALVGVPLVAGSAAIALALGDGLLPDRRARSLPPDLTNHARTLVDQYGLETETRPREVPEQLFTRQAGVAEVVVPPRSPLIGQVVFPGMVTDSGDLVVLSAQRQGEDPATPELTLAAGDTLLLEGSWRALDERLGPEEVLVVDPPGVVRRQAVPLGPGARSTLVVTAAFVAALVAGVPPAIAGIVAATALVLLGALDLDEAYRAVSWTTVILIAGLIPLSEAIRTTGAADDVAGVLVDVVGGSSPYLLLAGMFVLAAGFGIAVSNTATALILIPIGLSAATELDVAAAPVLMSLAVACAASFLTPMATPGNLIVMGPGGYRFGDYWRFGLPFLALFFLVAVFLVPLVWSF